MEIQDHPASKTFPLMDETDLRKLADDIRENGQSEPITLYEGMILDGRNRYRACVLVGVDPRFREVSDISSPVQYVISENLHRRHLTVSQRAAIAAEMIPLLAEEAKQRQQSTLKQNQQLNPLGPIGPNGGKTREVAAQAVGVGATSVDRAIRAKRDHPELYEKVKRGELSVGAASQGKIPPPRSGHRQDKMADYQPDTRHKQNLADSQWRKLCTVVNSVAASCEWLPRVDHGMIRAVAKPEDISTILHSARQSASALRQFVKTFENGETK